MQSAGGVVGSEEPAVMTCVMVTVLAVGHVSPVGVVAGSTGATGVVVGVTVV